MLTTIPLQIITRSVISTGLNAQTKAWLERAGDEAFTLPSKANQKLVSTLVDALINGGAWDLADYVSAYATDAVTGNVGRINLVNPSDTLGSYVNAITYDRKQGVKGDGVDAYVDTAFNPSSYSGRKYAVGNNTNGVWVYSAATGLGTAAVTAGYLLNTSYRLLNTNTIAHRIHTSNSTGTANLSGTGWEAGYKTGAGAVTLMNGTTTALAVTGLLDNVIPNETRKLFVSSTAYSDAGVSILIMGANMLSVNNAINTAITNYMNALALLP